jgi:hypothetical protein
MDGDSVAASDEAIIASWPAARTWGPTSWEGRLYLTKRNVVFGPMNLQAIGAISSQILLGAFDSMTGAVIHAGLGQIGKLLAQREMISHPVVLPLNQIASVHIVSMPRWRMPGRLGLTTRAGEEATFLVAHRVLFAKFVSPGKHALALQGCQRRIAQAVP